MGTSTECGTIHGGEEEKNFASKGVARWARGVLYWVMGEDCQQDSGEENAVVEQATAEDALRERLEKQDLSPVKKFEFLVLPLFV